jgi:ATP-dependent helicase/nuclease subunit B
MVSQTFRRCYQRLAVLPECMVSVEVLERHPAHSRFAGNPVLAHLERALSNPQPLLIPARQCNEALRMVLAPNPEAEAVLAAREILRHVRAGGRYRDCAVLLRRWEGYHDALRRVFSRYEIPFFLDRREPVAHHPLAELTRYALRTVAFGWAHEDWFGALKSGLATADEAELDHLENEALARGWKGETWLSPLKSAKGTQLDERLERLRQRIVPPFVQLAASLAPSPDPRQDSRAPTSAASHEGCAAWQCQPTGRQLAEAIREFWCNLRVEQHLTQWSGPQISGLQFHPSNSLHATVWEQMHRWLENLELAFANESLPLREWLPILEAGLAGLTVGVIPPALDQVLIGVIDRSRNPDLQLALVLGLNDSVFPAAPSTAGLLTEADRQQLAEHGLELAPSRHAQLGRERYYGYIACTRARKRLVLTCAARDANDRLLNPSPFLARVQGLVPGLEMENFSPSRPWWESEHARELAAPLITPGASGLAPHVPPLTTCDLATLMNLPALAPLRQQLLGLAAYAPAESLCPRLAEKLYGATLRTSVLRLEEFAVCPFKFFVSAGLRAQERKYYELDPREQGSFQHEVLARFHRQLQDENKRWRDLTPAEGRARIGRIAAEVASEFREGLLWSSHQTQFAARSLTAKLQDFIETGIGWMAQYEFDPAAVELAFGIGDQAMPAWELELDASHRLAIIGKMDRVDLWVNPDRDEALCVVMDYKGRTHKLDLLMLAHGLQLQLPAYLCVLRHLPNPAPVFGVARLIPAGIFYVNLRGQYAPGETRDEVLSRIQEARARAYQHTGRFDLAALRKLDNRPGAKIGDQFNYRLAKTGTPHQNVRDAMDSSAFADFLAAIENHIARLGRAIFAGVAKIDPYQKGNDRPCALCDYQSVCRIDPWRHAYRVLRKAESEAVLGCAPSPAGRQAGGPQAKSAAA